MALVFLVVYAKVAFVFRYLECNVESENVLGYKLQATI